nr:MAG TPA: hypothetical protein [Caudoviricetes sp.]DAU20595.1 MAG TPA: hypothetical protein [Caudoviricetes sp.]
MVNKRLSHRQWAVTFVAASLFFRLHLLFIRYWCRLPEQIPAFQPLLTYLMSQASWE